MVFADTSYFLALLDARDQWHHKARKALQPGLSVITSCEVINETVTWLQRRNFLSAALVFLAEIRRNPKLEIVYPDSGIQAEGWDFYHRWGGGGATAVDCTSFAIMKSRRIRKAFTFDKHFRDAGFEILS
jgi:predicted nucleic acid-binding protein